MSGAVDLAKTYLSLDGKGAVALHPVGKDFWETIDKNKELLPTMVAIFESKEDWPHWEMHPKGDEIVVLLEGAATMIIEENGKERRVALTPGHAVVIPPGAFHRALVPTPSRMLGITYGEGTQHQPLKAQA